MTCAELGLDILARLCQGYRMQGLLSLFVNLTNRNCSFG